MEYFISFFRTVLGGWGFDPTITDAADPLRALEIAGNIGIILAGVFPMVDLVTKYLAYPMEIISTRIGTFPYGAAEIFQPSP